MSAIGTYSEVKDQIREVLIDGNYMSQKDVEFCLGYDLSDLRGRDEFSNIEALRQELRAAYGDAEVATA